MSGQMDTNILEQLMRRRGHAFADYLEQHRKISDSDREILVPVYTDELRRREVATKIGTSYEAVKKRCRSTIHELTAQLEESGVS